jgi:DHA3 family macrolide efflux protein-like MFS transporter
MKLLREKDFLLLWLGQGVSNVGSSIYSLAIVWLIAEMTGSAKSVSLFFMILSVPTILIGPLAGVWVERWPKRAVIVITDLIRGLLSLGMVFTSSLAVIYALAFLSTVSGLFFSPAIKSALPRIVEKDDLLAANALSSLARQTARLLGPVIGGLLTGFYGAKLAFIINGISFILSGISECFIDIPAGEMETASSRTTNFSRDLSDGWQYIREHSVVKFVIAFFALTGLPLGAIVVLKVILLTEVLGFSAEQYGLIMSMEGAGLLLGSLFMGKWGKNWPEITTMVLTVAGINASFLALAFSRPYWLAALLIFSIGFLATITNIAYGTYLQKAVADEVRSRVFSFDMAISEIFGLLSMGAAGILGDAMGVASVVAGCGAITFIACLLVTRLPVYRESKTVLRALAVNEG